MAIRPLSSTTNGASVAATHGFRRYGASLPCCSTMPLPVPNSLPSGKRLGWQGFGQCMTTCGLCYVSAVQSHVLSSTTVVTYIRCG